MGVLDSLLAPLGYSQDQAAWFSFAATIATIVGGTDFVPMRICILVACALLQASVLGCTKLTSGGTLRTVFSACVQLGKREDGTVQVASESEGKAVG